MCFCVYVSLMHVYTHKVYEQFCTNVPPYRDEMPEWSFGLFRTHGKVDFRQIFEKNTCFEKCVQQKKTKSSERFNDVSERRTDSEKIGLIYFPRPSRTRKYEAHALYLMSACVPRASQPSSSQSSTAASDPHLAQRRSARSSLSNISAVSRQLLSIFCWFIWTTSAYI